MELRLLGTTGYHPSDRRHTACMMLPEIGLVFDAGTAMYRVRPYLQTDTLDIFLSHGHLDHVIGLTFLLDVLHDKQMQYVRVHGDAAKLKAVNEHLFAETLFPVPAQFDWVPLAGDETLNDGSRLSYFPIEHPGGSLGYRIDWPDRSLAYVTDTTADVNADYIDKIRDVDLLIHECYFPDGWEDLAKLTGHSCLTPVAQVARAANAKRLVLVHINPSMENDDQLGVNDARSIFPDIEIAHDEMVVEF